jgi:hypothetical protein
MLEKSLLKNIKKKNFTLKLTPADPSIRHGIKTSKIERNIRFIKKILKKKFFALKLKYLLLN